MGLSKHGGISSLIQQELDMLNEQDILLDGKLIKPSQCYHLSNQPPHILFNTNCPEDLMAKIEAILSKYKHPDEDSASR